MRLHDEPRLLFLYCAIGAMREPFARRILARVCAGSITDVPAPPGGSNSNSPGNAFLTLTAVTKW